MAWVQLELQGQAPAARKGAAIAGDYSLYCDLLIGTVQMVICLPLTVCTKGSLSLANDLLNAQTIHTVPGSISH